MSRKRRFSLLLAAFAALFIFAPDAQACSCGPRPTVLDAYQESDLVVIARVASVEKTEMTLEEQSAAGRFYVNGVKSTRVVVERVFKGGLKAGAEMTFGQGGGADCIWTFGEENVGHRYLFYLNAMKNSAVWLVGGCGRSNSLERAGDDLLYLEKRGEVLGKTRLSGTIEVWKDDGPDVSGRVVRVVGEKKTYEARTDADGVYEIYDLPAGKYVVELVPPAGWKVAVFRLNNSSEGDDFYRDGYGQRAPRQSPNKIPVEIEARKHTALDIRLEMDTAIRGKVFDVAGRPMKGVCIYAVRARPGETGTYFDGCTEEDGSFAVTALEPGNYLLVANHGGKVSSRTPFKTLYYPNVFERERAGVVTVRAGDHLEGFDIYVPKAEETVTVEGVFLYSDGKPVVEESVQFKSEKTAANVEGDARATTDAKGRFRVKILKGLAGELHGEMYASIGEFENCPKLEAVIKQEGGRSGTTLSTPALKIRADADIFNVELKYPFPGCQKAK